MGRLGETGWSAGVELKVLFGTCHFEMTVRHPGGGEKEAVLFLLWEDQGNIRTWEAIGI